MTKKNRFTDRLVKRAPRARSRLFLEALEERVLLTTGIHDMAVVPPAGQTSAITATPAVPSAVPAALPVAPTLTYNGGPLLTNVQVEGVYYNDAAGTGLLKTSLDGWLSTVLPSKYLTEELGNNFSVPGKTIGAGTFLGDDNNGITITPGTAIDDSVGANNIQSMLSNELALGHIPAPNAATGTLYIVFAPKGVEVTADGSNSETGFLGYHSDFVDPISHKTIYYAVLPYQGNFSGVNNAELGKEIQIFHPQLVTDPLTELQDITGVGAHELAEAITDPGVGTNNFGWLDTTDPSGPGLPGGFEIGDLANAELMTYKGYVMQELWSTPTGPIAGPSDTDFAINLNTFNQPTEGHFNGLLATFTDMDDVNANPSNFKVAINWDDGATDITGDGNVSVTSNGDGTFNIIAKHTYNFENGTQGGTYNFNFDGMKIFVADTADDEVAWNKPPFVLQEAPLTNVTGGNTLNATAGVALTNQVVATFTDPGSFEAGGKPADYSASINWGDNTGADTNVTIQAAGLDGSGNQIYQVLGNSHTYASAQGSPFSVQVTITHGGTNYNVFDTANVAPGAVGAISGRVFNDVPHAGLELASDPGLANWTVYIDQTNAGHFVAGDPTALTAADGTYTFTNVAVGAVQVGEILKPNFVESVPTSGGEQTVTVTAATTTPGVDFGDFQIVTPTVYDDSSFPASFQLFGSGWKFQNVGVNGESRYHAGTADPSTFAQWTTAPSQNGAGAYELYASWPAKATDATNATYQIFDQHTGNFLGSVTVDQTKAPTQANVNGTFFQKLGTFTSSNGSFVIRLLTDGANGNVVADAVMEASPPLGHNQKVLFYAGDFDATNPNANGLANVRLPGGQASAFQNFVVPVGQTWTINGLYSNDLTLLGTPITGADWSIHSGVSTGNGGTVIASASNAAATITATGRTFAGFYTENSVAVSGLHVVLGPGTYWMNVTPVASAETFNSNTLGQEQVGSDIANQQFLNSPTLGDNFVNANNLGVGPIYPNLSDGVIGSDPVLSGSSSLASPAAATAPTAVSSGTPSVSTGAAGSPAASLSTANLDSFFAQLGAAAGSGSSSAPVAVLSGNGAASASGAFSTAVTHVSSGNSTASVDDLFAALAQRKHGSGSSDLG